ALPDRLVEQDDAADVLLDPVGGEEEIAVAAAGLLCRLDADRVETLLDRAVALVRGEDPLALGDDRRCGPVQRLNVHFLGLRPLFPAELSPKLGPRRGDAAAVAPPSGVWVSPFRSGGTLVATVTVS